jgi:membrane-bound lytic murein transglycosylase A
LKPFRHLMIAQDTGTAIKGPARGDVYWGWGDAAASAAGQMKSPGAMVVLLPRKLAKKYLKQK